MLFCIKPNFRIQSTEGSKKPIFSLILFSSLFEPVELCQPGFESFEIDVISQLSGLALSANRFKKRSITNKLWLTLRNRRK